MQLEYKAVDSSNFMIQLHFYDNIYIYIYIYKTKYFNYKFELGSGLARYLQVNQNIFLDSSKTTNLSYYPQIIIIFLFIVFYLFIYYHQKQTE